jgi:hypothetical protein
MNLRPRSLACRHWLEGGASPEDLDNIMRKWTSNGRWRSAIPGNGRKDVEPAGYLPAKWSTEAGGRATAFAPTASVP